MPSMEIVVAYSLMLPAHQPDGSGWLAMLVNSPCSCRS